MAICNLGACKHPTHWSNWLVIVHIEKNGRKVDSVRRSLAERVPSFAS